MKINKMCHTCDTGLWKVSNASHTCDTLACVVAKELKTFS